MDYLEACHALILFYFFLAPFWTGSNGDVEAEEVDSEEEDWTFHRGAGQDNEESAVDSEPTESSLLKEVRCFLCLFGVSIQFFVCLGKHTNYQGLVHVTLK